MVAVFLFKAAMPTSWPSQQHAIVGQNDILVQNSLPLPSVIATMKFAPDVSRDIGGGDGAISRIAQE